MIPHPSAWFLLNGTNQTSEIENRITSGSKGNNVHLSLGPDGTQDGSYFFRGSQGSSINFSDSNSELDIGVSITILCWLYTYDDKTEMKFLEYKGMKLFVNRKKGWTFVGVSYNATPPEAKLWIDGNIVKSGKLRANFDPSGSQLLMLGGDDFKGKITQLMLFNLTLTQEQIQGIKGRMKLPGETESYIYKIKMILFRYFKTYCFERFTHIRLQPISPDISSDKFACIKRNPIDLSNKS